MHTAHAGASPDDLDLATLGRGVARSIRWIALATALAGGASFAVLSLMTPKYASEATIELVNEDPSIPRSTQPNGELSRPDLDAVRTQARVLQSRDLAARVARDLKLASVPEFAEPANSGLVGTLMALVGFGEPAAETVEQRVLNRYFKSLQVTPYRESRVIGIEARSADPSLAADIANALVKIYRDDVGRRRVDAEREPNPGLDKEIAALETEIRGLEAEVERERAKLREVRIPGIGADSTLNTQQLQELNTKLNDAKSQRTEAEARARVIREMLQSAGQVDASPDVLKSPIIQQLQVQKARIDRQLAELSATLLPAHPRMQQLRSEQAGTQKQLRDEAQKIVLSLENEARVAGAREANLKTELDRMVQKRSDVSVDTSRLRQLDADLTGKREILSGYKKRQDDVRVRAGSRIAPITVRLVQQAVPSADPVQPKKSYALLAMAITALSGFAIAVARSVLSGTRSGLPAGTRQQAQRPAAMRESGPLPIAPSVAGPAPTTGGRKPTAASRSSNVGSLEEAAQRLVARAGGQPGYRTLITGADAAMEAAATSVALARQMVGAGKQVVLIDWSAAAKSICSLIAVPRVPGVRELIANEVPFEAVLHVVDEAGFHAIAPGKPRLETETPAEIERMRELLSALDESYDHVLVTAEPSMARRLMGLVDGAFDAGIQLTAPGGHPVESEPGFLGFSAPDLDVIRLVDPSAGAPRPPIPGVPRPRSSRPAAVPAH